MFGVAGLVLLQFFVLSDGEQQSCQLTSNIGNGSSNTAVVNHHQRLILNCSATQRNGNGFTFKWVLNEHEHSTGVRSGCKPATSVPSIVNLTDTCSQYSGRFKCEIRQNDSLKESCDFTVIVKATPFVYMDRWFLGQKQFTLYCFAQSFFKPNKISWYKNDQQIFPHKNGYVVNNRSIDEFYFQESLKSNQLSLNDSGNYSCEVTNMYGTSRGYIFLSKSEIRKHLPKQECPEFTNQLKEINITIGLGSTKSLLCEIIYDRSPIPIGFEISVKVNNTFRTIDEGNRYPDIGQNKNIFSKKLVGNEDTLINYTIVNATKSDSGEYKCTYVHADHRHCPKYLHKIFIVKVVSLPEIKGKHVKHINVPMVVAVSVAGTLCGLVLVIYVCHLRRKMKAQLYVSCPDYSPELRWDVFVSYSGKDFVWVNDLCQMLEQPPFNLRVCLHQRDWELGKNVQDNMVDSVYCSHKTLIIVSENYLQSEYCMQELQIAMHSEINGEHAQRERIVLIKIDDVSMQLLPRFLRQKSFLDCSDPEHARHLETNLLRVLPRRELVESAERFEDEEHQGSDEGNASCSSSSEIRLQELEVV